MLTFQKACTTDIPILRKLAREIWTVSYGEMLPARQIEYMLNWMYSEETIQQEMDKEVLWELIRLDDENIGFIALTPEAEVLKLNKLYILGNLHGQGFGQAALRHVIEYGTSKGFQKIYLTVNKQNAKAMKAYEKAGFIRTDSLVSDIGDGFVMDDYIYTYPVR